MTKEMDMRKIRGSFAAVTVVTISFLSAALVAPASAESLSSGCENLNAPAFDGLYSFGEALLPEEFAAGERVSITAGPPVGLGPPTTVSFFIDDVLVASTPFPGTIEYVFPAAGSHTVSWGVSPGSATWPVSCAAPVVPVPTSKEQCKNDGWKNFPQFRNQGDCVSFVATGGKATG
jgi:hypothetical protein